MTPSTNTPALLGGTAVRPQGPPEWPPPDADIERALSAAVRAGTWGKYHGGGISQLEDRLGAVFQSEFVLTCGSGTFAVELAMRGLNIGAGDEVILAAYDYPGNLLCVYAVGAHPVLVDVAAANWNLCLDALAQAVSARTKAVIASHLHGGLVPMRRLMAWAAAHNLAVIEDAAQCPGALIDGRRAGTWGDVGTLSFGGSKLLTAGRGGAVLTQQAGVFQRLRTHQLRGNLVCPLSELQAAVLLPQLDKLEVRNRQRLASVQRLTEPLAAVPGLHLFMNESAKDEPAYYKVGLQYDPEQFGLSRRVLVAALRAEGIACDEGFRALHVGRSAKRFRCGGPLTQADRAHAQALVLHHPVLLGTAADLQQIPAAFVKLHAHRDQLNALEKTVDAPSDPDD